MQEGSFVWHELMTSDAEAATRFYKKVIGWDAADSGIPGMSYTVLSKGGVKMAGLMKAPDCDGGMPTVWTGYVGVGDVDACAKAIAAAGGSVLRPAEDIPQVGRFAVVADPQGTAFSIFKPSPGGDEPAGTSMKEGAVGWNELLAPQGEEAFAFYSRVFGWVKSRTLEMEGCPGGYQIFAAKDGGNDIGAVMTKPKDMATSGWNFYFSVPSIDTAMAAVKDNGGTVLMEPMEVPGGMWVINAADPQGAHFGLVGPR